MRGATGRAHGGTAAIVRAAQRGNRSAFAQLYTLFAGMVYGIAVTRLPNDEARDVVQEVFLRALRRLPSLRDPLAFGGWLAAITRNAVCDLQRQRMATAPEEEQAAPCSQHDELEVAAALRAIRALPAAYRQTVMLRVVQGLTGPEIADRTGLTPASVRVNLHRGLKLLRQQLLAVPQAA